MGIILSLPLGKVGNFVAYENICHGFVFRFSWRSDKMGLVRHSPRGSALTILRRSRSCFIRQREGQTKKIQYRYVSQLSFARHWHRAGPGAVHSGYIALGDPTDLATAWPARERMAMLYTPQSVAEALYGRKQASK